MERPEFQKKDTASRFSLVALQSWTGYISTGLLWYRYSRWCLSLLSVLCPVHGSGLAVDAYIYLYMSVSRRQLRAHHGSWPLSVLSVVGFLRS